MRRETAIEKLTQAGFVKSDECSGSVWARNGNLDSAILFRQGEKWAIEVLALNGVLFDDDLTANQIAARDEALDDGGDCR